MSDVSPMLERMAQAVRDAKMSPVGFGGDPLEPKWDEAGKVHDWRNYISQAVRDMWHTFTPSQRVALAENAEEIAGQEEWD